MLQTVAFLGLGKMGAPMAANLAKAGHRVTAFDLSAAVLEAATSSGAVSAACSAEAAAEGAELVVSMLPTGRHAAELYLGSAERAGLLDALSPQTTCVDCSTICASTSRRIAAAAAVRGLGFLDAPVSGGTAAAAAGSLTFMCGGEAATLERARPVLQAMGPKIFHAGGAGSGQVAKACNNMLLAVHMIGTCEALELGARHGLDPDVLSDILVASSGRNWSLEAYNPSPGVMESAPASRGYKPGFAAELMLKDLSLAMELAQQVGLERGLGKLAKLSYEEHVAAGQGATDFSSIMQAVQSQSGAGGAGTSLLPEAQA